ncbi:MAG: hypothetical protein AB7Y46_16335 [Armatimonadota bacterium]
MISDLLAKIYQFLFEATGSDFAPVVAFAIILVLLGTAVGYLVTALMARRRRTPAPESEG